MKSAIYVVDDFPPNDHKTWADLGREQIQNYSKRFNIPIVNTTKDNSGFYKKFYDTFHKALPNEKIKEVAYCLKYMRHYEFINSDYDYAYFVDLDFIVTNPDVNVNDLVKEDTLYINAYNHTKDRAIVPHKFYNKTTPRYHVLKYANPEADDDKLINFGTGFYCTGKQTAIDIVDYIKNLGLDPMTEDGIKKLSDVSFPACLDETFIGTACNFGNIKYDFANIAGLCDEMKFYYEEYRPSVFFHVVGRDAWWTKDRAYKLSNHFFNYFRNKNV